MTHYYVADEDGDMSGRIDAPTPLAAAKHYVHMTDLGADPGYKLYVFEESQAIICETAQTIVLAEDS